MFQNTLLSYFYLFDLLIISVLLISASIRSYRSISAMKVAAFGHFVRSWLGFAFFWIGFILIELFVKPLYEIPIELLFNYIIFFISPFMIEIFNFYLSLFSNRLNQFETYFPILIGITWGLSIGAIISNDSLLLVIPIILMVIISLFFMIYSIVIYIRLERIKASFGNKNIPEIKFLDSVRLIVIFTIIGGSFDVIWLPLVFLVSDLFYQVSTFGLGLIAILTFVFLLKVKDLIQILPNVDISLIINELN